MDDHVHGERIHDPRVLEDRSHQAVLRDQPRLVLEPHDLRDVVLLLPEQPIRPAAALQVHGAPDAREELLRGLQPRTLRGPEQTVVLERPAADLLEPAERVDIPQASAALLQLRLQQVRGGTESDPAVARVVRQALGEPVDVAPEPGHDGTRGFGQQIGVAGQQPGIQHGGRRIEPFRRQRDGLPRRPDGVTHGEAGVPERIQQLLRQRGDGRGLRPVVQQHDVDVRPRAEGAAPVAAERDQRRARRPVPGGGRRRVQIDERDVDQLRAPPRRPQAVMTGRIGPLQRGQLVLQPCDGSRNVRRRVPGAHVTGRPGRVRRCGSG